MADSYDTVLPPEHEQIFQQWKKLYAPNDTGEDYDLRGAFKSGFTPDPKTGHWPDTYKKPNHPTFSDESIYSNQNTPGGHWGGVNSDQYIPAFPNYTTLQKLNQLSSISPIQSPNIPVEGHPLASGLISPSPSSMDMTQNYQGPNASSLISPKIAAPAIQSQTVAPIADINQQPFHQKQAALLAAAPNPDDPAFKHKWWANTLNAIAGGLAGAAGHPEIGAQLNRRPYTDALEHWKNQIAATAPLLTSETGQQKLGESHNVSQAKLNEEADRTNATLLGQTNKLNETAQERQTRELREQQQADEKRLNDEANIKIKQAHQKFLEEQAKNKSGKNSVFEKTTQYYDAIDQLSKSTGTDKKTAENAIQHALAAQSVYTNPVGANEREQGRIAGEIAGKDTPEYREMQRKLDEQKAQVEEDRAKAILQAREETKQQLIQPVLESYNAAPNKAEYFSALPSSLKATIYQHPGFQPPKPLTPQARQQLDIGRTALNHITSVEELLKDPDIQANLGALSGRITLAKQYVGGDPFDKGTDKFTGTSDPIEVDLKNTNAKEQRFLTDVSNLLNWEVKNIAGNRPAHQLFERLQKNAPGTVKGYFSNVGALQGIRDGIVNAMDGFSGIVHQSKNQDGTPKPFHQQFTVVPEAK